MAGRFGRGEAAGRPSSAMCSRERSLVLFVNRKIAAALAVGPKSVVPSGPPWRLGVSKPPSCKEDPDEVAR